MRSYSTVWRTNTYSNFLYQTSSHSVKIKFSISVYLSMGWTEEQSTMENTFIRFTCEKHFQNLIMVFMTILKPLNEQENIASLSKQHVYEYCEHKIFQSLESGFISALLTGLRISRGCQISFCKTTLSQFKTRSHIPIWSVI